MTRFSSAAEQGLRRGVRCAHLERDLEGQPARVARAAILWHPEHVRILRGTLDKLSQAFVQLDGQPCAGPSRLSMRDH